MSEQTALKLVKLILFVMMIQIFLIGFVLWQSYEGRVHLIEWPTPTGGELLNKLDSDPVK